MGFGLATKEIWHCAEILATPIETLPIQYLGLPLTDRRLRTQDWQPVLEKVEKRLGVWRGRLLSHGGCLVLVKAVLAAIPGYFMSGFRMPAGVRRRLESAMRSFLWRGADPGRGVPLLPGAQCAGLSLMVDSAYTTFSMPILPCYASG